MLKKTIEFEDLNGNKQTEECYFNLTKTELTQMQLEMEGGFQNYIDRIVKAKSTPELVKVFKEMILRSYGIPSPDGKKFVKTEELRKEFESSLAYDALFMELATNDKAALDFVTRIVPAGLSEQVQKQIDNNNN